MEWNLSGDRPIWLQLSQQLARRILVGAYPPGCATAAPGERLTRDCVNFLLASRAAGATLFGAEGGLVEVVDEPAQ